MNADFLLTANRQQIDVSLPWNQHLRSALGPAFIHATQVLSESRMKYTWPAFLPSSETSDFFQTARQHILEHLRDLPVLESMGNSMVRPHKLIYLDPSKFCDKDGVPFTLTTRTAASYLSLRYPAAAVGSLLSLGVRQLSEREFLTDLERFMLEDPPGFQGHSIDWHSCLAQKLTPLVDVPGCLPMLQKLRIIPLMDGTWSSAGEHPVLYPCDSHVLVAAQLAKPAVKKHENADPLGYDIPSGWPRFTRKYPQLHGFVSDAGDNFCSDIHRLHELLTENRSLASATTSSVIPFVDTAAGDDEQRRKFLSRIGVKPVNTIQMCSYIFDLHRLKSFAPRDWSRQQLISHAKFLYQSSWTPPNLEGIWFATADDGRCRGSEIYSFEARTHDSLLERIITKIPEKFPQIHNDYLEADLDRSGWLTYLREKLGVMQLPQLVEPMVPSQWTQRPKISSEFRAMFAQCATSDVLQLLVENWQHYSKWIQPDAIGNDIDTSGRNSVVDELRETVVETHEGHAKLMHTVLPGLDISIDDNNLLPTLSLNAMDNKLFKQHLPCLGVSVENDSLYYIRCLMALKEQHSPEMVTIVHIYEKLQYLLDDSNGNIEYGPDKCYYEDPTNITQVVVQKSIIAVSPGLTSIQYQWKDQSLLDDNRRLHSKETRCTRPIPHMQTPHAKLVRH